MNLNHLMYFNMLCEVQHYQQAAANLNITQPALSYAIVSLEEELGVKLFEKKGKRIFLTAQGEIFHKYASNAIKTLNTGIELCRKNATVSKQVIISACSFIYEMLVLNLINMFKTDKNNKEIFIQLQQANTFTILQQLKNGSIDFAFCGEVVSEASKIKFFPIETIHFVAIAGVNTPFAQRDSVSFNELAFHDFIAFSRQCLTRNFVEDKFIHAGLSPKIIYEVEGTNSLCSLVEQGKGIAIVPNSPILKKFLIKILPIEGEEMKTAICLAVLKEKRLTPAMSQFQDFILSHCPPQNN